MADQPSKPGDAKPAAEKSSATPAAPGTVGKALTILKTFKWPIAGAAGAIAILSAGSYWYFFHNARPEHSVLLSRALECLKDRDNAESTVEARRIASELDALRYRAPEFAGAVPYILGIVDFRKAQQQTDRQRLEFFRSAAAHLEQAVQSLDAEHRLDGEFTLGIARHAIGDISGAQQPLQRVIREFLTDKAPTPPPEFFEAAATLEDGYLEVHTPSSLLAAIRLNEAVLSKKNLDPAERDRALLRRAQAFGGLHDGEQARTAMSQLSHEAAVRQGAVLIRAQVNIAERHFKEARVDLEALSVESGLDSLYPRQALYLLGVSYEADRDYESALRKYGDVVRRYPDTAEGLAGNVRRAELLRKAQRWEEALDAYVKALERMRASGFTNRWLQLDEFRRFVLAAFDDFKRTRAYEFAVELARHMRPLFPPKDAFEALERVATANELWAAQLDSEIAQRPFAVREQRNPELLERWKTSGKAYAELAETLHESPKYADVLWISSEHYRRGHDFQNALVQVTRYINTQPKQRLPLAYVRRGEILMDLGRFNEALDHFERVLAEFPNDIAAFAAMYLVGACEVERNNPEKAVAAWQRILHEPHLDPSANEWQSALFALGRIQFEIALTMKAEPPAEGAPVAEPNQELRPRPAAAYERLDDSINRFEEFVARYPNRPEAPEARFLLAKALRDRAVLPRHKLKKAETDNARKELQAEIQRQLGEAQDQIELLIETLQSKETAGLLDLLGQRMLRDAYFERAHNLYALDKFERAIEAYTSAANRYVEDPNVVLAYIQMANCYDRLGKPIDARGVAIQAMLIHKNLSEKLFTQDKTLMNRDEWRTWLEWAGALRDAPKRQTVPPSATNASSTALTPQPASERPSAPIASLFPTRS
ncbi:MAG TPA: tetratricopeptide repeat protein [Planctomycetaceae bacterium]|jgi:tetratricopeptide (TPR) repeat protein|nr:tetratricopeptide repeat protein [Planctomycetaceae bacterium]